MSKILIVSATEKEIEPFAKIHKIVPDKFTTLYGHQITICQSGVGVVAATFNISKFIDLYNPELVIQAGICGCYPESGLNVGEGVIIDSECMADLGVMKESGFSQDFKSNLCLVNPEKHESHGTKNVKGNTVSTACSPLVNAEDASVESMEGYALFFVCLQKGVPFAEIRTVSNVVSRDRSSWNFELAAAELEQALTCFLQSYKG